MRTTTATATRFVRRTQLAPTEYRKNFQQIDREIIETVTSVEADRVTPLMSKIYLRMVNAPSKYFERDGVLRFTAEERDGKPLKAWLVLCEALGVSGATANKALAWLHQQGIIGYFAGKNGVGIRIFLNRASSSIGKKILPFRAASSDVHPASPGEAAFIDSFAVLESLEKDTPRRAQRSGVADNVDFEISSTPTERPGMLSPTPDQTKSVSKREGNAPPHQGFMRQEVSAAAVLRGVVESRIAAERENLRDWLETRGLPKVARVVQREVLDTLRRNGLLKEVRQTKPRVENADRETHNNTSRRLSPPEITELAAACVSLFEVQGRPVERTISEMAADRGGFVLGEDLSAIEQAARDMIASNAAFGDTKSRLQL